MQVHSPLPRTLVHSGLTEEEEQEQLALLNSPSLRSTNITTTTTIAAVGVGEEDITARDEDIAVGYLLNDLLEQERFAQLLATYDEIWKETQGEEEEENTNNSTSSYQNSPANEYLMEHKPLRIDNNNTVSLRTEQFSEYLANVGQKRSKQAQHLLESIKEPFKREAAFKTLAMQLKDVLKLHNQFTTKEKEFHQFFGHISDSFLSATTLKEIHHLMEQSQVSLMLCGRSSAGKSSLVNALFGFNITSTGSGHTTGRVIKFHCITNLNDAFIQFLVIDEKTLSLKSHPIRQRISLSGKSLKELTEAVHAEILRPNAPTDEDQYKDWVQTIVEVHYPFNSMLGLYIDIYDVPGWSHADDSVIQEFIKKFCQIIRPIPILLYKGGVMCDETIKYFNFLCQCLYPPKIGVLQDLIFFCSTALDKKQLGGDRGRRIGKKAQLEELAQKEIEKRYNQLKDLLKDNNITTLPDDMSKCDFFGCVNGRDYLASKLRESSESPPKVKNDEKEPDSSIFDTVVDKMIKFAIRARQTLLLRAIDGLEGGVTSFLQAFKIVEDNQTWTIESLEREYNLGLNIIEQLKDTWNRTIQNILKFIGKKIQQTASNKWMNWRKSNAELANKITVICKNMPPSLSKHALADPKKKKELEIAQQLADYMQREMWYWITEEIFHSVAEEIHDKFAYIWQEFLKQSSQGPLLKAVVQAINPSREINDIKLRIFGEMVLITTNSPNVTIPPETLKLTANKLLMTVAVTVLKAHSEGKIDFSPSIPQWTANFEQLIEETKMELEKRHEHQVRLLNARAQQERTQLDGFVQSFLDIEDELKGLEKTIKVLKESSQ